MKSLIAPEEESNSLNSHELEGEESFLDNLLTYAMEGDDEIKKRPECDRCRYFVT